MDSSAYDLKLKMIVSQRNGTAAAQNKSPHLRGDCRTLYRVGNGSGTDATTLDDECDHMSDREFKLLRLEAKAGE